MSWLSRAFTAVAISWFVVGVWYLSQEDNRGLIYTLVTVFVGFELAVLALSILLGFVIFLFALTPLVRGNNAVPGASEEDLDKLKLFRYGEDGAPHAEPTCSICLCDYEEGDILRELPCKEGRHVFHAECVDEWLMQKLSCPICRDNPLKKGEGEEQV